MREAVFGTSRPVLDGKAATITKLRRCLVSLALVPLATSCGGDQGGRGGSSETLSSYRFTEELMWLDEGDVERERTRGAFDWEARKGWAEGHNTLDLSTRTIQVGDACFDKTTGSTREKVDLRSDGFCSSVPFLRPLFKGRAGCHAAHKVEIHGTQTTHYRCKVKTSGGGWFEIWADENGLIRRTRYSTETRDWVDTIDYYDFGAPVEVKLPSGVE
jgi:hypothetical protein